MSGESIDDFEGVHGRSGFGARNLEGEVSLEFADSHSLVITNTCFTKVDSKKITYDSGGNSVCGGLHSCEGMSASDGVRCHRDQW